MIYPNVQIENTQNKFANTIIELQLEKLLQNTCIAKSCSIPAFEILQFLLLLVF